MSRLEFDLGLSMIKLDTTNNKVVYTSWDEGPTLSCVITMDAKKARFVGKELIDAARYIEKQKEKTNDL